MHNYTLEITPPEEIRQHIANEIMNQMRLDINIPELQSKEFESIVKKRLPSIPIETTVEYPFPYFLRSVAENEVLHVASTSSWSPIHNGEECTCGVVTYNGRIVGDDMCCATRSYPFPCVCVLE